MDKRKRSVVEICLPDQWRVYQMFISKLKRVYYLDLPAPYAMLASRYPAIDVKEFGYLIQELELLRG